MLRRIITGALLTIAVAVFFLSLQNSAPRGMLYITNETAISLIEIKLLDYYDETLYNAHELLPKERIVYKIVAEGSIKLIFTDESENDYSFLISGYAYPGINGIYVKVREQDDSLNVRIER
jgi:hypothetical protein